MEQPKTIGKNIALQDSKWLIQIKFMLVFVWSATLTRPALPKYPKCDKGWG